MVVHDFGRRESYFKQISLPMYSWCLTVSSVFQDLLVLASPLKAALTNSNNDKYFFKQRISLKMASDLRVNGKNENNKQRFETR